MNRSRNPMKESNNNNDSQHAFGESYSANLPGCSRDQRLTNTVDNIELLNANLEKELFTLRNFYNYPDKINRNFQEIDYRRAGQKLGERSFGIDYELYLDQENFLFQSYMTRIREHLNRSHTIRIIEKHTYEKKRKSNSLQDLLKQWKQIQQIQDIARSKHKDFFNYLSTFNSKPTYIQALKKALISSVLSERHVFQEDLLTEKGPYARNVSEEEEDIADNLSVHMFEESSDSDYPTNEEYEDEYVVGRRKSMQKKLKSAKSLRLVPEKVAIKQKSLIYGFGVQVRQLSPDLEQFQKMRFPVGLSQRDRLLWLLENRDTGIWVQCTDCFKWRYLHKVKDALEIKAFWVCSMNPDFDFNKCSIPQAANFVEQDLIDADYSPGSIVLAKVKGFPWWPAIVDDNPEYEQFFWLKEDSNEVCSYHVVFLDSPRKCTNAWVDLDEIRPYIETFLSIFPLSNNSKSLYKRRLKIAKNEANKALQMEVSDRLLNFGFLAKFKESNFNYKTQNDLST